MTGIIQVPIAVAYLRIEKQSITQSLTGIFRRFNEYKFALLGGLFNIIGTGFLWLSFYYVPASIASPITGSSGALTVLFSRILLKEKIVSIKYVGIVLAFIGVMGIILTAN